MAKKSKWPLILLGAWLAIPLPAQDTNVVRGAGTVTGAGSVYPDALPGYVSDHAGLLSSSQEEEIEQWLWQTESRTGVEIAVVTIESINDYPGTDNASIETFAQGVFDVFGIGNLPDNNGALLLVAVDDRKARIELGAGYGRSRDAAMQRIMDREIVSEFRKDDYAGGIRAGVKALMKELAGVSVGVDWGLILMLAAIPVLGAITYSLYRNGKRGWGWVCLGMIIILLLAILRILASVARHTLHRGGGSSGGWSSGGFGGGFGGGFSGGGGATGSW